MPKSSIHTQYCLRRLGCRSFVIHDPTRRKWRPVNVKWLVCGRRTLCDDAAQCLRKQFLFSLKVSFLFATSFQTNLLRWFCLMASLWSRTIRYLFVPFTLRPKLLLNLLVRRQWPANHVSFELPCVMRAYTRRYNIVCVCLRVDALCVVYESGFPLPLVKQTKTVLE